MTQHPQATPQEQLKAAAGSLMEHDEEGLRRLAFGLSDLADLPLPEGIIPHDLGEQVYNGIGIARLVSQPAGAQIEGDLVNRYAVSIAQQFPSLYQETARSPWDHPDRVNRALINRFLGHVATDEGAQQALVALQPALSLARGTQQADELLAGAREAVTIILDRASSGRDADQVAPRHVTRGVAELLRKVYSRDEATLRRLGVLGDVVIRAMDGQGYTPDHPLIKRLIRGPLPGNNGRFMLPFLRVLEQSGVLADNTRLSDIKDGVSQRILFLTGFSFLSDRFRAWTWGVKSPLYGLTRLARASSSNNSRALAS